MEQLGLVGDLALLAGAALAGGVAARLLRLPTVLGYLAAGIAIGPHTPGPVGDVGEAQRIADLGVALLMFTIGVRFFVRDLAEAGLGIAAAAIGQVSVTFAAGLAVGAAIGLDGDEAAVVGAAAAISSTMIGLRLLEEHHGLHDRAGKVTVAFSLAQDVSAVLLIAIISGSAGAGGGAEDILVSMMKAVALVAGVSLIGFLVLPHVLRRMYKSGSRELFLLSMLALALGTASISAAAGLSLAFGAFLAGLMISESDVAHRTLVELFPLREVFAIVFFVAVGMLVDPDVLVDETSTVAALLGLGVAVKVLLIGAGVLLVGAGLRAAVLAALALGQMGEFSFVIARTALDEGVVDGALNGAVVTAVALSMALSTLLFLLVSARAMPALAPARPIRYIRRPRIPSNR